MFLSDSFKKDAAIDVIINITTINVTLFNTPVPEVFIDFNKNSITLVGERLKISLKLISSIPMSFKYSFVCTLTESQTLLYSSSAVTPYEAKEKLIKNMKIRNAIKIILFIFIPASLKKIKSTNLSAAYT